MRKILILFLSFLVVFGCKKQAEKSSNPLLGEFNTPFNTPPFDKIDTSNYIPAFEKGIAEQQAEIDAIVNNTGAPTFENTILPFDQSGQLLRTVSKIFYALKSANSNSGIQAIAQKVSPILTKHQDNISLNEKLFQRIKVVYENREANKLDALQKRLVERFYKDFVRNGANLSEADQAKLREINQNLSVYELKFDDNHLAETNSNFKLVIDKKEDLDGLPQGVIDAALDTVKNESSFGKWVFTLQKPSLIPFLQYAKNRELREKIYKGYYMRGNNNDKFDNKENFLNIVNLRAERSKLLGYKSYADYSISENMAKTPEKVYEFLNKLMVPAQKVAKRDRDEMQKIIYKEGGKFKLDTWDWWYYAEKLRKEKYDLDESEIKPYFVLSNVRDGMFYVANKLYGLTFSKLTNVPVYSPDVDVFEVKEADGKHAGVLYLDYYIRDGKEPGAWCDTYRDQYYEGDQRVAPLVYMVCNFTKPAADTPSLLTWDEVTTLFHEFGHALHNLSIDGKYRHVAGNLPNDMVELPSQYDENWAGVPEVLNVYAKHYKTGQIIPKELLDKLQKSLVFNQAFETVEYIAASILDLDWHSLQEPTKVDVLEFEKKSMDKLNLMKEIIPRYRTTYFSHVVSGGYAAGYYVYLWAAVLDSDAFQAFVDSGDFFNKDLAAKFRKFVLKEGGDDEGMIQYKKFRGQDPSLDPLLKKRGLE